jgi:hypothetical protein
VVVVVQLLVAPASVITGGEQSAFGAQVGALPEHCVVSNAAHAMPAAQSASVAQADGVQT